MLLIDCRSTATDHHISSIDTSAHVHEHAVPKVDASSTSFGCQRPREKMVSHAEKPQQSNWALATVVAVTGGVETEVQQSERDVAFFTRLPSGSRRPVPPGADCHSALRIPISCRSEKASTRILSFVVRSWMCVCVFACSLRRFFACSIDF